jgi:hypothetical protein
MMLLRYRDPRFWDAFRERHWRPRVPTVLRQPLATPLFSEAVLLRAMKGFVAGLERGDRRKHCLVSLGGKETAPRRPLKALFRERNESFDALESNIGRLFRKEAFGWMVTQMQAVEPALWDRLAAFLQDGREALGLPVARSFLDLFYGNYGSGFTGLHKDTQEILAFVVRGEKRMLAWPFDYFLGEVKGLSAGHRYFNKRLSIDYRKYRKDAIVLDARAGDILYWPADHWHVAEPLGGFSAMVSLGLFVPDIPGGRPRHAEHLRSGDMSAVVTGKNAAERLRWLTSYGFELGGPSSERAFESAESAGTTAGQGAATKREGSLVQWARRPGGRLLVAANGHSMTLPDSDGVRSFLERVAAGAAVTAPPDSRRTATRIAETGWSPACRLETRARVVRRPPERCLLDWLARVSALA